MKKLLLGLVAGSLLATQLLAADAGMLRPDHPDDYVVQRGDNLSSIAAANGTTLSALTQLNGLANPNMIRAGQTLCIR